MLLLVIIWAVAFNWLAAYKGYYLLPKISKQETPLVTSLQLFTSFAIYLLISLLLAPFLAKLIFSGMRVQDPDITSLPISVISSLQFIIMVAIFLLLISFFYQQNSSLLKNIWKQRPASSPPLVDFGLGIFTWFISFPIATLASEFTDLFLKDVLKMKGYEQAAVSFVKQAMDSPVALLLAMLSVLVLAPLIEEFLFRGTLQTYCKKRLGTKPAILLSSFSFAIFHYTPSQGLGNISIMVALFILGGYLGYLYERQRSLWAPIGLHVAFNAVSAFRILFFSGG